MPTAEPVPAATEPVSAEATAINAIKPAQEAPPVGDSQVDGADQANAEGQVDLTEAGNGEAEASVPAEQEPEDLISALIAHLTPPGTQRAETVAMAASSSSC